MALLITEECINCQACEEQCPNHAITQADTVYVIDAGKCTECVGHEAKPQCIDVCPVDCIVTDPGRQEDLAALRAKFEALNGEACPDVGGGWAAR